MSLVFMGGLIPFIVDESPKIKPMIAGAVPGSGPNAGMMLLPDGCFEMGERPSDEERMIADRPLHKVCLSSYWIDTNEVSVGEYIECVRADVCEPGLIVKMDSLDKSLPISGISWKAAQSYCKWQQKELPTEAQWEYAARASVDKKSKAAAFWTEKNSAEYLNVCGTECKELFQTQAHQDSFPQLAPVGSFQENAWGLHNMGGNLSEWVRDYYDTTYYAQSDSLDPLGPKDSAQNIVRGGNWKNPLANAELSLRIPLAGDQKLDWVGFRCARAKDYEFSSTAVVQVKKSSAQEAKSSVQELKSVKKKETPKKETSSAIVKKSSVAHISKKTKTEVSSAKILSSVKEESSVQTKLSKETKVESSSLKTLSSAEKVSLKAPISEKIAKVVEKSAVTSVSATKISAKAQSSAKVNLSAKNSPSVPAE